MASANGTLSTTRGGSNPALSVMATLVMGRFRSVVKISAWINQVASSNCLFPA